MLLIFFTLGLTGFLAHLSTNEGFKVPIKKVSGDGNPELFTGIPYMIYPQIHEGKQAMMHANKKLNDENVPETETDRFLWKQYEPSGRYTSIAQFMIFPLSSSCYAVKLMYNFSAIIFPPGYPFIPLTLGKYSFFIMSRPIMFKEPSTGSEQCSKFSSTKSGFVVTKVDNKYLTATDTRNIIFEDQITNAAQMKWEPVVTPGKGKIINMKYDEDEGEESDHTIPLVISKRTYINNSTRDQNQVLKATHKQVQTYSFTLSASLKIFASVSVEAGIPLVGSVTVETGFEVEFGVSTTFSTEVTREFTVEEPLVIPPKTRTTAIATLSVVEGVKLPVTVTLTATLDVERLEEVSNGRYMSVKEAASGDFVKAYLLSEKVDGRIISVDGNVVTMETDAIVEATYGIHTLVTVNEEAL